MNDTNRALNRILLLVIGLVVLALGGAAIAVAAWPAAADVWATAGSAADAWLRQTVEATRIEGARASWIGIAAVATIVVVIVLLVLALTSVAGRRSKTVLRSSGEQNPLGRVTVSEAFVSDALKNSLADRDEILSAHVTANDIRRVPVLHVAVTPRRNTDPRVLVAQLDQLLDNLATLTGRDTATYISLHAGLRARLARDQHRLS